MTQADYSVLLQKLLEAGVGADALANLTTGGGKPGNGKSSKAKKKDERKGKSRLAPGQFCKSGTCNFNHGAATAAISASCSFFLRPEEVCCSPPPS